MSRFTQWLSRLAKRHRARHRRVSDRAFGDTLRGRQANSAIAWRGLEPLEDRLLMAVDFVIHISVDGLRPDAITTLGAGMLPNFYRLRTEASFTDNARTDYDSTETLQNHTGQLTGRPMLGPNGHAVTSDSDGGSTIHALKGSYVAGTFDVVHDNGLRTGLYASKDKFDFFDRTWNAVNGAPDVTGADNGTDKIDKYLLDTNDVTLTSSFVSDMTTLPHNYSLLHWTSPDQYGHGFGWMSSRYLDEGVKPLDALLGSIFNLIDTNATFTGKTAIILTTDHAGTTGSPVHSDPTVAENYTIPFYVWGPGISAGDLYANPLYSHRANPGAGRPDNSGVQPIRDMDAANLALQLLDLPAIQGSTFETYPQSVVPLPIGAWLALTGVGFIVYVQRREKVEN